MPPATPVPGPGQTPLHAPAQARADSPVQPVATPHAQDGRICLQQARLPNGVELAYDIAGSGPALVLIHGVMGDWRSWDAQWPAFCARYRCLRYSRRYNHPNRNTLASPDHSALHEAQDLGLLLDHVGWSQAICVGSSYGAFIALALALDAPERCLALALSEPPMMRYAQLSASGREAAAQFKAQSIAPANLAFRRGDDEAGARIMTGGINGQQAAPMAPEAMARRLQNIQAMKMLALSSDEFPWLPPDQLAALPMPVLLLRGARTPAIHAEIFHNVCTAMPQAETRVIADAGHGSSREQPETFNAAVLDFLQRRLADGLPGASPSKPG